MIRILKSSEGWRSLLVLAAAVAVAGIVAATAWATGTVDQRQETNTGTGVALTGRGDQMAAQTFTAGQTGALTQIDLLLNRYGDPGDLVVEVWRADDGVPAGGSLASEIRVKATSLDSDRNTFEWVSVPLPVTLGGIASSSQYAIVVWSDGGVFPNDYYYWASDVADPYTAGEGFTSLDYGGSWLPGTGVDFAFRTYVTDHGCPTVGNGPAGFQLWNVRPMSDFFVSQGYPDVAEKVIRADRNSDGLMCWAGVRGTAIWIDNNFPLDR